MLRWTGWLGVVLAGILVTEARSEEPERGPFEVVLLSLSSDWQAVRYHRQTGESWYAFKGDWKPVPEAGEAKPPLGDYQLYVSAQGASDWVALRLERKSGRSWRLAALKWIEMKVLGPDELPPQQPVPPAVGQLQTE